MTADHAAKPEATNKDFLFQHLRDLPYFRGLLRAVESRFYQDFTLQAPTYDLGCGDGHFARRTFEKRIDIGLDPWHAPIHEARRQDAYHGLVEADAARAPFPSGHFASGFSNSVLEHIPHVQDVLNETARVLRPGALFLFCVPNENFARHLSIAKALESTGLRRAATAYRRLFNRVSRHLHCDGTDTWRERLERAGFRIESSWTYFSPGALGVLEWGHYLGVPSALCKLMFGRWILAPWRANLWLTLALVRHYYNEAVPQPEGAYTFYVTRRTGATPTPPAKTNG